MEFLNPFTTKNYLSIQHIERYKFAANIIKEYKNKKNLKILDIACGIGYGTLMLSFLGYTIGADYDLNTLKNAKTNFKIEFLIQANALCLPFKDESFDIIVSFETIEHVINGNKFLSEMKRVLKNDGLFICSTPNIEYTAHPPFHLKEYEPKKFFDLLKKHFRIVEKYGQYFTLRDRFKDVFNWYFKSKFITILEFLRLKNRLKQLKQKVINKKTATKNNYTDYKLINSILREDFHPIYGVKKFYGKERLLRIMIGVCWK